MKKSQRYAIKQAAVISFMALGLLLFSVSVSMTATDRAIQRQTDTGKRTALVIGNSAYKTSPLENPTNDARDMAALLRQLGFKVIVKIDASQRQMEDAMNNFAKTLHNAEIGLFFFAGHGMQVNNANYLIPVDANVASESDIRYEAVNAGRMLGKMSEAGTGLNIVILDACRNNPFKRSFRSSSSGLAQMDAPMGTILAYATAPGSVAADGTGRNGLYTGALLRNFNKQGVTVQRAFNNTGLEVLQKSSRKQIPWVSSTPVPDFYLAGGAMMIERPTAQSQPGETGSLEVKTDPVGAEISIDGVYEGVSPLKLDLATGIVRITGEKSGYKPESKKLRIRQGRTSNLTLILDRDGPALARLYVETEPADARVRILNINPPYSEGMELTPGNFKIEVSKSGYQKLVRTVQLVTGSSEPLLFKLKKTASSRRPFTDPVTGMEFVFVKGGCFQMGQTSAGKKQLMKSEGKEKYEKYYNDEQPRHEVCVDGFYLASHEVTVGQWRTFVKESGYRTDAEKDTGNVKGCYAFVSGKFGWADGKYWDDPGFTQSARQPVACVSYNDVQVFIKWLNKKGDKRFRLPTEAEWEYAARGKTSTVRYWGNGLDEACDYANVGNKKYWSNSFSCDDGYKWSAPVGSFRPNKFGLYDMLGNVWEWCADRYAKDYYKSSPGNNPQGPASGSLRVFRGGSWNDRPALVRAADRSRSSAANRNSGVGFRLASPGQ